ncbi:hypothetical protein CCHR01_04424 [Colletotrichum chrysophilum]|uniref:Uncharacterized protein n=1 Tax=Colletotrichum chrysophilum TaxID=1836956 RepID=A0AAD9AWA5_9PEZI|nr:hypothetical protein CCHR01_04424 [Colletotrichum chrysophilum]
MVKRGYASGRVVASSFFVAQTRRLDLLFLGVVVYAGPRVARTRGDVCLKEMVTGGIRNGGSPRASCARACCRLTDLLFLHVAWPFLSCEGRERF